MFKGIGYMKNAFKPNKKTNVFDFFEA